MSSQGFRLESAHGGGTDLVVTGEWTPAARRAIEDGRADGLVLNYAKGFRGESIDFIRDLPIRKLDLLARWIDDLTPIHSLAPTLTELRVESAPHAKIDLQNLAKLTTLASNWTQVEKSVMHCARLANVTFAPYSAPNLYPLACLEALKTVILKECRVLFSLDGIEDFPPQLRELSVMLAPKLADIESLRRAKLPRLSRLELDTCRKLVHIEAAAHLSSLTFLNLSEGNEISSLAPVQSLTSLETLFLYGSTRILDGDLSPVTTLPKLMDFRLRSRRHYKPSTREIETWVDDRRQRAGLDRLFTPAP